MVIETALLLKKSERSINEESLFVTQGSFYNGQSYVSEISIDLCLNSKLMEMSFASKHHFRQPTDRFIAQ